MKTIVRALLLVLVTLNSNAQSSTKGKIDTIVAAIASDYIKETSGQGFSVGIVAGNKTYLYNFGTIEYAKDLVPSDNTLYEIGSVTKTFTGIVLANAVLEKKLSIDDDIRKYLPGNYPNLQYNGRPIQFINLTNLTSGLPDNMPGKPEAIKNASRDSMVAFTMNDKNAREDFFNDLHNIKLDTIPGIIPKHSNLAAQLLGYIMENIYQTNYDSLVKKYICNPLQMGSTTLTVPQNKIKLLAKGYNEKHMLMPGIPTGAYAAGGLKSTISDMAAYMKFQLNEQNAAVKLMHQISWTNHSNFSIAMNWFIKTTFDGKRQISTDGTTFGFNSYCLLYPDENFAVVLLANNNSRTASSKLAEKANQLFNEYYYTPQQRASDAFGFSPSINRLFAELAKKGFSHAEDVTRALKTDDAAFNLKENEVNNWAYFLAKKNKSLESLEIFKLNTLLFPNSWNVYDSYGEALLKNGQKAEAVKMYKQSLALNPNNDNGRKVLEGIIQ